MHCVFRIMNLLLNNNSPIRNRDTKITNVSMISKPVTDVFNLLKHFYDIATIIRNFNSYSKRNSLNRLKLFCFSKF